MRATRWRHTAVVHQHFLRTRKQIRWSCTRGKQNPSRTPPGVLERSVKPWNRLFAGRNPLVGLHCISTPHMKTSLRCGCGHCARHQRFNMQGRRMWVGMPISYEKTPRNTSHRRAINVVQTPRCNRKNPRTPGWHFCCPG